LNHLVGLNDFGRRQYIYLCLFKSLVGVGDLIHFSLVCIFQDLVGVGDLKIPAALLIVLHKVTQPTVGGSSQLRGMVGSSLTRSLKWRVLRITPEGSPSPGGSWVPQAPWAQNCIFLAEHANRDTNQLQYT